ncbi:hypothetical protein Tco_1320458 [Tanacetum coccineum]
MIHTHILIMSDVLKWFVDSKNNGYIEFLCFLLVGYDAELELPSLVWPKLLTSYTNYVELVDARANVYMVKKDRDYKDSAWSFNGSEWDGNEVDYVFNKDHEMKCRVVGCHDPRMYQPIPHKMLLNSKVNHDRKRVPIAFNGVKVELEVSFSVCSKQKTRVGVAFTGFEWERLCETAKFSAAKAIIISSDESGCSFVGKVINGVVADIETKFDSATGENSNASAGSKKTFISVFSSCMTQKDIWFNLFSFPFDLSIPVAFHCHRMRGGYRDVWINARGRSLYMSIKSHIDERAKTKKNTNVYLVGEMHRLKEFLDLNVGDRMVFELVSSNISSDEPMFFNVIKLV